MNKPISREGLRSVDWNVDSKHRHVDPIPVKYFDAVWLQKQFAAVKLKNKSFKVIKKHVRSSSEIRRVQEIRPKYIQQNQVHQLFSAERRA